MNNNCMCITGYSPKGLNITATSLSQMLEQALEKVSADMLSATPSWMEHHKCSVVRLLLELFGNLRHLRCM